MAGNPIDIGALDKLEKLVNSGIVTNDNGIQVTLVLPGKLWASIKELVEKKQDQDFAQQFAFPPVVVTEPPPQEVEGRQEKKDEGPNRD